MDIVNEKLAIVRTKVEGVEALQQAEVRPVSSRVMWLLVAVVVLVSFVLACSLTHPPLVLFPSFSRMLPKYPKNIWYWELLP